MIRRLLTLVVTTGLCTGMACALLYADRIGELHRCQALEKGSYAHQMYCEDGR